MRRAERQAFRDRLYPVGMRVEWADGHAAWRARGTIIDNTGVMLLIERDDGTNAYCYDHDVCSPEEETTP